MGKSKAAAAASSSNEEEAAELQDLGALAQQMEEQLMQEFEALLASRRKEQPSLLGAKPSSSSSSLSRKADGQQQLQQEARDAVYWRSMYERLRDVRETEAERMLAEVTRHAEERERALTELVAHLEENAGTGSSNLSSSSRHRRDVRLSDVSVAGAAPAPMDMAIDDEEAGGKGKGKGSEEAEKAVLTGRVATLEGKVTALKRVLMAYQRLTSLCISLEEAPAAEKADGGKSKGNGKSGGGRMSTLRCTAVNYVHKKALEFQLKMNCDEEDNYKQDAIFKPLRDRKSLPACMQEEVAIETQQCPILLRTILGTLFSTSSSKKTKE